ncbi:hypothetical protein CTM61_09390 [Prevotella intermedia]|nr:hypothetical protein CTM61_09390 [Prevotella intermedia]AWX08331.1 hypothetical protein CTM55_11820 [Prevotella intermedia]
MLQGCHNGATERKQCANASERAENEGVQSTELQEVCGWFENKKRCGKNQFATPFILYMCLCDSLTLR